MKIKILYLSCLILIFALSLLSCGGGTKNSPTASNSDNLQPPSIGSAEDAIELIRNNSSIKSMPNDSYRSVETDGFDIKEENGTFILASEAMGIEYIFSGGATLEECTHNKTAGICNFRHHRRRQGVGRQNRFHLLRI